jgi:membrane protease YdiL (CAAX protease family)
VRQSRSRLRLYVSSVRADIGGAVGYVVRDRASLVAVILLILPWWTLVFLRKRPDWLWQFGEIVAVGLAFWWMSRSGGTPSLDVRHPRAESALALALVVLWMIWRAGICARWFWFLPVEFSCYKNGPFEIAPKVIEMVILPIAVLFAAGYHWREQGLDWIRRAWWIALPVLLVMFAYGAYSHWSDLTGYFKNIGEFFLAAGLPEEILFRALLLTRLEAWWRNPVWALLGSSVIFGLSHLPIDYLVFTSRNWNESWIMLLTFQTGFGAVFAFAYQRTRNVWPIAMMHALVDAMRI